MPTLSSVRPESEQEAPDNSRDRIGFLTTLLVTLTGIPAAVIMVPNTISYVVPQAMNEIGLGSSEAAALVRAGGLALPALLLALPLAAVAARRYSPWIVLVAGLAVITAAEAAASVADSVTLVSAVRLAEGVGAGLVLPATLVLVLVRRSHVLAALWGGALVAGLLGAMPLCLLALPAGTVAEPGDWRVVMRPYPVLTLAALAAAGLHGLSRLRGRGPGLPALRHGERTLLLMPAVPAAGFAFLAVVTTYGWSSGAQLMVAGVGVASLAGLAIVGSLGAATGSPLAHPVTVLTTGFLTIPVVAPLSGLLSARGGLDGVPFAAAAACALIAAIVVSAVRTEASRSLVFAGHGLAIVAILLFLAIGPDAAPRLLVAPLAVLGAGTGAALAASLRCAQPGSALFGLAICFPAVLTGHLIVGSLQIAKVNAVVRAGGGAQDTLTELASAYRLWLVVAGMLIVVLAALAGVLQRRVTEPAR